MIQFGGCVTNQWCSQKQCERFIKKLLENAPNWKGSEKPENDPNDRINRTNVDENLELHCGNHFLRLNIGLS